jgi:hypothetical protein
MEAIYAEPCAGNAAPALVINGLSTSYTKPTRTSISLDLIETTIMNRRIIKQI